MDGRWRARIRIPLDAPVEQLDHRLQLEVITMRPDVAPPTVVPCKVIRDKMTEITALLDEVLHDGHRTQAVALRV